MDIQVQCKLIIPIPPFISRKNNVLPTRSLLHRALADCHSYSIPIVFFVSLFEFFSPATIFALEAMSCSFFYPPKYIPLCDSGLETDSVSSDDGAEAGDLDELDLEVNLSNIGSYWIKLKGIQNILNIPFFYNCFVLIRVVLYLKNGQI